MVQVMDLTLYEDDGRTWRTEEVRQPTWETVEVAIRRLDRSHLPFVWLYLGAEREQGHVTEARVLIPGSIPDFEVVGGDGEYAMNANREGRTWRYLTHRGIRPRFRSGEVTRARTSRPATVVPRSRPCSRRRATSANRAHWIRASSGSLSQPNREREGRQQTHLQSEGQGYLRRSHQGEGKDRALRRVLSLPLDPHSSLRARLVLPAARWGVAPLVRT